MGGRAAAICSAIERCKEPPAFSVWVAITMLSRATRFLFAGCGLLLGAPFSTTDAAKGKSGEPQRSEPLVAGRDLGSQLTRFHQATLYRNPRTPQLFAANCEDDPQWWGRFCVFYQSGERIDWVAKVPPLYREWEGHYIVSLTWWHLDRLDMDVLQVMTSTHMGNGFLWLFALEGHELRTLVRSPGCGFADSPALVDGLPEGEAKLTEPIKMDFKAPPDGGAETLELAAEIMVRNPDSGEVLAQRTKVQTWLWNPKERVFRLSQSNDKR